jgi:hypothetical protein
VRVSDWWLLLSERVIGGYCQSDSLVISVVRVREWLVLLSVRVIGGYSCQCE